MPKTDRYITTLAAKLNALYRDKQAAKPVAAQRAELNGYMEAALILSAYTVTELQQVIDAEYFALYGKHRRERDKSLVDIDVANIDWKHFDKPKWER